jgi:hypothetical protein
VPKKHFDSLFKVRDGDHGIVLDLIQQHVTEEDTIFLTAPINKVEIQHALLQMHPDKSLDLDGFNSAFYQRF